MLSGKTRLTTCAMAVSLRHLEMGNYFAAEGHPRTVLIIQPYYATRIHAAKSHHPSIREKPGYHPTQVTRHFAASIVHIGFALEFKGTIILWWPVCNRKGLKKVYDVNCVGCDEIDDKRKEKQEIKKNKTVVKYRITYFITKRTKCSWTSNFF